MKFSARGGRFYYTPKASVVTPPPSPSPDLLLEDSENVLLESDDEVFLEG